MQNPSFTLSLSSAAGVLCAAIRALVAAAVFFLVALPVTSAHGQCACNEDGWARLTMNGQGVLTRPNVAIYDFHVSANILNIVDGGEQIIDGFTTSASTPVMVPTPMFTRLQTGERGIQHLQPWKVHWSNHAGWQGDFTLDFAACGGKVEISETSATAGFTERNTYKMPDIHQGYFWLRVKFEDEGSKPGDFKSSTNGGLDTGGAQNSPSFNLAVNLGSVGTGGSAGSMVLSEDIFNLLQAPDFGSHVIDNTRANVDWELSTVALGAGTITITQKNTSIVIGKVVKVSASEVKFEAYDSAGSVNLRTITLALVNSGIKVTDSRDASNPITYVAAAVQNGYSWTKTVGVVGVNAIVESVESVLIGGVRNETVTSDGRTVKRSYQLGVSIPFSENRELLIAETLDPGPNGLNLTTSYQYWDEFKESAK